VVKALKISLDYKGNKGFRLLSIYERLNKGEVVSKEDLVNTFGVTAKTIQRDIDDLRAYLSETHFSEQEVTVKYDKNKNGYYLVRFEREWFTNEEVLALCKILLESRAFQKDELSSLISKLIAQVTPNDRKTVEDIIRAEHYYYVPLKHNQRLLSPIWILSQFITKNEIVSFTYARKDGVVRIHSVKPVALMFSEFYFYLITYMADGSKDFPTVFRIDRMSNILGTNKKFRTPYKEKFNDGDFRKRVQFMYTGELKRVTFEYSGQSVEAVLDRLPTAVIMKEENGLFTIKAEAYGDGIYMWLRSQGDYAKII
jgi:predicted DNA-binding transcriptional regulator YafY